jgi:nucleoside triphosphate pyrophosphatase
MATPRLILASGSPRRQSLLREAGYVLVTHPADLDEETYPPGLSPPQIAEYLALAKADAIAGIYPDDVTLGADTVVALGSRLLGKPTDADDARRMLGLLSGTTHHVTTGVAAVRPATGLRKSVAVTSTVQMRRLSAAEIGAYVASGQWEGKAGGYGIQDQDPFVTNMAGSLTNIVGLPMEATTELLSAAGISPTKTTMP